MAFKGWKTTGNLKVIRDNGEHAVSAQKSCAETVPEPTNLSQGEALAIRPNKKVKGATCVEVNGIAFDSKLEAAVYVALRDSGLVFDMQVKFILLESFVFNGQTTRPWTHKVDFVVYLHSLRLVVEVKGWPNDVYPYKLKMLRWWLARDAVQKGTQSSILFVHSKKEILPFMSLLKQLQTDATVLETLTRLYSNMESEAIRKRKKRHASATKPTDKENYDGTKV